MMSNPTADSAPVSRLRKTIFAVVALCLGLALLEGIASFAWIVVDLTDVWTNAKRVTELQEESHCKYDRELGWVHKPQTTIKDFYGPGRNITINEDGLRAQENYSDNKPQDQYRTVLLGDSFTLGYGVDDRNTFPQMLEDAVGAALQVVNMGQGGYSVGQSYLWLKRLYSKLKPDAVVCVFIVEDFRRLAVDHTANGYGTPRFEEYGGRLTIENIPVPARLAKGTLLLQPGEVSTVLSKHSSLVRAIDSALPSRLVTDEGTLSTGIVILHEIHQLCHASGQPMALVLTPTLQELSGLQAVTDYQNVSGLLREFAAQENIPYLDLRPAFVERQKDNVRLFLDEAFHHYNEEGNRLVSSELATWLPQVINEFPTAGE